MLSDECQDVDYREHKPKTIIAWAAQVNGHPQAATKPKFKIMNHDDVPHVELSKLKMHASDSQSAVVMHPQLPSKLIWKICYYAAFHALVYGLQYATLNIAYLDFDFHWTGVHTREDWYLPTWEWP